MSTFLNDAKQKFLRLPSYINTYGLTEGLSLGLQIGRPSGVESDPEQPIYLKSKKDPFWLRPTVSDHSIFWQTLVKKQYDLSIFKQTEELIRRGEKICAQGKSPLIIDGGANIGLASRWFLDVFPTANLIAIEPDSNNFKCLQRNLENYSTRSESICAALASEAGFCRIVNRERGSAGFITESCLETDEGAVKAISIGELISKNPKLAPWIVKLDIEGAQSELFSQNTDWVDQVDLLIMELDDWQFPWRGSSQTFLRAIAARRFDVLMNGELLICFRHIS